MSGAGKIFPLLDKQQDAVVPDNSIWLSASAGTGKTQVLSARVFRLLLQPRIKPEHILCLTFTKAGATEMAGRINNVLAGWVRMDDARLAKDLKAIGAPFGQEALEHARTLFAAVLDAPGGGLRIQTIHSFCQSLLAGFPLEAGIVPGFKAMEERDQKLLVQQVLIEMLAEAERNGNQRLLDNIAMLSVRMGEQATEKFLLRCAAAIDLWQGEDAWTGDLPPRVNALLGLDRAEDGNGLATMCSDDAIDVGVLTELAKSNIAWGTKTGLAAADIIHAWTRASAAQRLDDLDAVLSVFLTQAGTARKISTGLLKVNSDYEVQAYDIVSTFLEIAEKRALIETAKTLSHALEAGRAFAFAYQDAKQREGVVDFDDLIRNTANLLSVSGMAEWIRYKLDQQFDHILIDEAQDTNLRQWQIVDSLAGDFFAGAGAKADRVRTLFTVGDYKQAIFGFQGTSPINYEWARRHFRGAAEGAGLNLADLTLAHSFRSAQSILDFVDKTIAVIEPGALALPDDPPRHEGDARPGQVTLWNAVSASADADDGRDIASDQEQWLSRPSRILADNLARQISAWLDEGLWLHKENRWARAGDFMILVRRRTDLAALIVARLYARDIPVAGIDRLRLGQPLGVQDLLAAVRFALQPHDDLNLANLLVSPIIGWTQEQLLKHGYREKHTGLWSHLRDHADPVLLENLHMMLQRADFMTPYRFLEWILTGEIGARAKLISRLGSEVIDPLDELLGAALDFERDHVPGLQQFLHWFESSDEEIKREISDTADELRVMTVHGAKGLQAPVVIIADSCADPTATPDRSFEWKIEGDRAVPIFALRKNEMIGPLGDAYTDAQFAEMAEHWRLLYVAMTRAEERLYMVGTQSGRGDAIPANSWYAKVQESFEQFGVEKQDDGIWIEALHYGDADKAAHDAAKTAQGKANLAEQATILPEWLTTPAAEPETPPRPLVPSAMLDDAADPPVIGQGNHAAMERGRLLHSLFERLPELPVEERGPAAHIWLEKQGGIADSSERGEMVTTVLRTLSDPQWAELFGPDALAEAPLAARVGERVISGTVDRLHITDKHIWVVDFKTSRYPPSSEDKIPAAYVRQMAAYAAVLRKIYPHHAISAGILYTQTPQIFTLSPELLAAQKLD